MKGALILAALAAYAGYDFYRRFHLPNIKKPRELHESYDFIVGLPCL